MMWGEGFIHLRHRPAGKQCLDAVLVVNQRGLVDQNLCLNLALRFRHERPRAAPHYQERPTLLLWQSDMSQP